jgi:hypothetical protein
MQWELKKAKAVIAAKAPIDFLCPTTKNGMGKRRW